MAPSGPPTVTRVATVLLALLLRVKLVAIALAASIDKGNTLPLGGIICPELQTATAGAGNYGETAGSCGIEQGTKRQGDLSLLPGMGGRGSYRTFGSIWVPSFTAWETAACSEQ